MIYFLVLLAFTIQDDFETLAGKFTERWSHLSEEADFAQLNTYKTLYEKNKDLQFQPHETYKIPKIVHFIWIGPKNFPRESIKNVRTWMAKHPDWTFKFWTDRPRPSPCNGMEVVLIQNSHFQKLKPLYDQAPNWAEKANLLTFEILSQEGGVYVDHDANALQPFDPLHQAYDFYGCLETPQKRISGFTLTAGVGLIGSKPHHPVIERCIDVIEKRWQDVYNKYSQNDIHHEVARVMNGSYISLTFALQDSLSINDNTDILFPASYFFAQAGLPSFYSQHFFGNSWIGSLKKTNFQVKWRHDLGAIQKKIRTLTVLNLVMILILSCISLPILRILFISRK